MQKNNSYILWLPSWYPTKLKPFEGDFIQRHAYATSLFTNVHVIFVAPDEITSGTRESFTATQRLTEHIVHFQKSTGFLGRVLAFMKWKKLLKKAIKEIIKKNGKPAVVHVHVPFRAGMAARWIRKHMGVPYIVTEHATHYYRGSLDDFSRRNIFYRRSVARIFREAAIVTNVSAAMGNMVKAMFGLKGVHTIPNVVDTDLFYYPAPGQPKFRFIHVSTLLESQKNVRGILRAIANLANMRRDFDFVIVGPATAALKLQVAEAGLDDLVLFTGEISYAEVAEKMRQASVFVLFSRYENSPCVIIEALCCGLPVISSNVGGISEIINQHNGRLVPAGNEPALLDNLQFVMNEYDNFNRQEIANHARQRFNYSVVGEQFNKLYLSLIRNDP